MEYSSLYDLISFLQYGTNLHIGVLFFGSYGNEKLSLPKKQTIHAGAVCDELKSRENGFKRCFKCRNMAIEKALKTKKAFGGLCINGVYEYTRPVVIDDDVACIIYIGNILQKGKGEEKIKQKLIDDKLLNTLEQDFDDEKCEAIGNLIASYITILLKEYPQEDSKFNPLVENVKSYIEANLEFNIDIGELSGIFHYNEKYLGRLFKRQTGMSLREYISRRRVERAKELLKTRNYTVISVSNKVGFNNVTYFNRVFKRYFSITPTEFQQKYSASKKSFT